MCQPRLTSCSYLKPHVLIPSFINIVYFSLRRNILYILYYTICTIRIPKPYRYPIRTWYGYDSFYHTYPCLVSRPVLYVAYIDEYIRILEIPLISRISLCHCKALFDLWVNYERLESVIPSCFWNEVRLIIFSASSWKCFQS